MFLNIFFLCQLIQTVMVSSNQQIAIPIQTYPVYQQSAFNNAPLNVPVLLLPANNNNPYMPAHSAQTVIPNDLASVIVSKVLSSPTVHSYVEPSSNYCDGIAGEYKKPSCHGAIVPHVTNNYFIIPPEYLKLNDTEIASEKIAPKLYKVVEDDLVIKPVSLKKSSESNLKRKQDILDSNKDKLTEKREQLKERRKNNTRGRRRNENNATLVTEETTKNRKNDSSSCTLTKIKSNKQAISIPENNHSETNTRSKPNAHNNNTLRKNTQKRPRKRKESRKKESDKSEDTLQPDNSDKNKNSSRQDSKHLVKQKIQKSDTQGKDVQTLEIISNRRPTSGNEMKKNKKGEDGRVARGSKDNDIIKDFVEKYPEVPKSLAQSMLAYVKNQFQNNFGTSPYYSSGIPFSYEQFFNIPQLANFDKIHANDYKIKGKSRKRKQKHRKRNSNKKKRTRNNTESIKKSAPLIMENETIIETTTTEISISEEINASPVDLSSQVIEDILEMGTETTSSSIDETSDEVKESENVETEISLEDVDPNEMEDTYIQELDEEDVLPTMYDNALIEDYYPIFVDNAGNFDDDNDYYGNTNERYYYTTDQQNNKAYYNEIKKPRRSFKDDIPKLIKHAIRDNLPKHTYFEADKEALRKLAREIPKSHKLLQPKIDVKSTPKEESFKSPPALEFPDFLTKKVDKSSLKSDEYRNNRFDEIFENPVLNSKLFPGLKKTDEKNWKSQESRKNIETVYAKSKVAKYGAEENPEDSNNYSEDKSNNFKKGHLSYVIAKSLKYPD